VFAAPGWPLEELRAVMDRAALFVGGDSGPMHIAAASDVPIVAIFGPTLPAHWAPWRPAYAPVAIVEPGPLECRPCDQRVCAPGDFRCSDRSRRTGRNRGEPAAGDTAMKTRGSTLETAGFVLIALSLGVVQLKLLVGQGILFSLAAIVWLIVAIRMAFGRKCRRSFCLMIYAGLTLVSAAFSAAPLAGFIDSRQLLMFLMVPIVRAVRARFARVTDHRHHHRHRLGRRAVGHRPVRHARLRQSEPSSCRPAHR
jgi:hypothetical protein